MGSGLSALGRSRQRELRFSSRDRSAITALLVDVVLMATANILIFSVWYWIVDSPGMKEIPRVDEPWEFLFPSAQAPFRTMNPGFRVTAIRRVCRGGRGKVERPERAKFNSEVVSCRFSGPLNCGQRGERNRDGFRNPRRTALHGY